MGDPSVTIRIMIEGIERPLAYSWTGRPHLNSPATAGTVSLDGKTKGLLSVSYKENLLPVLDLHQGFPTHGPRPIGGPPSTIEWAAKMFQVFFFFFHEFSTKNGFLVENNINYGCQN